MDPRHHNPSILPLTRHSQYCISTSPRTCLSTVYFISIHASCTGEDGTTGSQQYSRHESKYIITLERAKDIQITRRGHTTQQYLSLIHISEPTRRTPISYAVFCLKKKKK